MISTENVSCCDLCEFTKGRCHRRGCSSQFLESGKCGGPHGRVYQALIMTEIISIQTMDTLTGPCEFACAKLDLAKGSPYHCYRSARGPARRKATNKLDERMLRKLPVYDFFWGEPRGYEVLRLPMCAVRRPQFLVSLSQHGRFIATPIGPQGRSGLEAVQAKCV
jgi:hypothetical protein